MVKAPEKKQLKPKKALNALAALAHESRLDIFLLLTKAGETGVPAGTIAENLKIPAATLSFHLSNLSAAGLVKSRKEGRMVIYTANLKRLKKLAKFLTAYVPKKEVPQGEEHAHEPTGIDL